MGFFKENELHSPFPDLIVERKRAEREFRKKKLKIARETTVQAQGFFRKDTMSLYEWRKRERAAEKSRRLAEKSRRLAEKSRKQAEKSMRLAKKIASLNQKLREALKTVKISPAISQVDSNDDLSELERP
jgi:hypothetical protein